MNDITPPREHHHTAEDLVPARLRRFIPLMAVVGISLAAVGYLVGLREPARPARAAAVESGHADAHAPPAVSYSELRSHKLGPNAHWHPSLFDMKSDRPGPFDPVLRSDELKQAALADRAKNRAYDGAPPTIPHPVSVQSAAGCLACHGEGIKVGDRVASKMSHQVMSNCTQCHVEQSTVPADTGFAGLFRSGPGERANPAAPPTIPHRTWLRQDCTSCHGTLTRPGTRTTHPWLTNCTQCHAPNAALDQTDFNGATK
jgi:cytochrome c-type protein NapB